MSAQPPSQRKTCRICGANCAGRPRVKDRKGRYYCRGCYDKAIKAQAARKRKKSAASSRPAPPAVGPRKAPPKRDVDENVGALTDLESVEPEAPPAGGTGETCEGCGAPMPDGAILCTSCGYNRTTGERLKPIDRTGDPGVGPLKPAKPRKSGGGIGLPDVMQNPWFSFAVPVGIFGTLLALAKTNDMFALAYFGLLLLFSLVVQIVVLVKAFQESALHGVLCLLVPFYMLYFVLAVNDNPHIKALFGASMMASVGLFALLAVLAKSMAA